MGKYVEKGVEVIAQHGIYGEIMPIKIRFADDNGEMQSYKVLRFREKQKGEESDFVSGSIPATSMLRRFDCVLSVFGTEKRIVLYYFPNQGTWKLRYE